MDIVIPFEHVKWMLGFCVAGYLPLVTAIGIMYWELIKSKNNEAETLRLVLPLIERMCQIKEDLTEIVEDLHNQVKEK